jgi:hypothetical protein
MAENDPKQPQNPTSLPVGVRRLTPETTTVFRGTFSLLHCVVKGDDLYRGVFAVMLFPISHPDRFVSLRYTDVADKIREIGVIEDLSEFAPDQQELIRASLAKHYYENIITRVYSVQCEYGLLFFDVETQQGRTQFMMPWRYDRAEDYGASGKVLLDANDNRFIIPDVSGLPPAERQRFTNYIYW